MSIFIFMFYIAVNIIGISLMYVDKKRAKQHQWRIKETTIWLWALLGGAIGAAIGMQLFRHKNKKPEFKAGLPLLAAIHIVLLVQFI